MARKPNAAELEDDLRPEYDFSKMRFVGRGIYAKRFRSGTNLALLDRDVREAFPDDRSVNEACVSLRRQGNNKSLGLGRLPFVLNDRPLDCEGAANC